MKRLLSLSLVVIAGFATSARASDWTHWRGPLRTGVGLDKNLPEKFAIEPGDGSNLIWKAPYGGRSTPIVMNGYVYLINNSGEGVSDQERVMCFSEADGKLVWEHKFNVFHTDIVAVRVGWTNLAGDPETGNIYAHGVQGLLFCFDGKTGKVLWSHSLTEEYGRISGYGGRVTSPVVDGNLVMLGMANASWGEFARGGNRFVAFDKKTGDIVWWSETGFPVRDTYYSVPVVATINGQRLLISGGADGGVHAFQVATGKKIWSYVFGAGAVNCSPVVEGTRVYIGHGEENLDNNIQGRFLCLDAGEVTDGRPKLVWDKPGIKVKYCSPVIHEGKLYVCDETAKMYCLDAATGKQLWGKSYGRNAKGSPVWADGKIYVAPVNSEFVILKSKEKGFDVLHRQFFPSHVGADVEVNGSPAVANGRVYFMTSEELYCIGKKDGQAIAPPPEAKEEAVGADAKPAWLQVVPADVELAPGESASFKAHLFDANGRFVREAKDVTYTPAPMLAPPPLPNAPPPPANAPRPSAPPVLAGEIKDSTLTVAKAPPGQFGNVDATAQGLKAHVRVRVAPVLPYVADFSKVPEGRTPGGWVNTQGKFAMRKVQGKNVLVKLATNPSPLVARANAYIGMPSLTNYTIAADVMGGKANDELPDMGVVACRYTLMLDGNKQQLRLVSWDALPRVDKTIRYEWKADAWYHLRLGVFPAGDKAMVRGKVWEQGQDEPTAWTLELEDPTPNIEGSPALYANATGILNNKGAEIFFDQVRIQSNLPPRPKVNSQ